MELWQQQLAQGFYQANDLLSYLDIDSSAVSARAEKQFQTRVPVGFAQKMRRGDQDCPLLKQVLAIKAEDIVAPGYSFDPLQEQRANPIKGLLHKYPSRVLLTLSGSCAINCRYCFRRHFPYQENQISKSQWQSIWDYIAADSTITEVIFSGGDPLLIKNVRLAQFISSLEAISHLDTLRFHSRIPVVLPERIDSGFCDLMLSTPLNTVMVIHCNHPNELCQQTQAAFQRLKQANTVLLNQSVLLKGVNDSARVLAELSKKLFKQGVLPYYLHLLDKVAGSAHFDVADAQSIYQQLQTLLSGYLVPKLVKEQPGVKHKTLVTL